MKIAVIVMVAIAAAVFVTAGYLEFRVEIRRGLRRLYRPVVPAAEIGTFGRRTPRGMETPAAAGGAPGAERARSSPQAPGAARRHADAMHASYVAALEGAPRSPAAADRVFTESLAWAEVGRRPVNGRTLPDQPRRGKQPWATAAQPVLDTAALLAEEAAEAGRAAYVRSQMREGMAARDPETLRRVLDGLRNLDERQPVFGEAPVARVLGLADLGPAGDRSFAERMQTL